MFCPEDLTPEEKYESTSYAYSTAFYHSPQQIDAMDDKSDTWSSFPPETPSISQRSFDVVKPYGKIIIGEWNSNHLRIDDDEGWWCREGSRNYLFVDGQVRYIAAEDIRPAQDGWPNPNLTIGGIRDIDWPTLAFDAN